MAARQPRHSRWRLPLASILALATLLVTMAVAVWLAQAPRRVIEEFAGHLSAERYAEAAQMLAAPSRIQVAEEGDLIVVDCRGNATTVPQSRLPFLVGGGTEHRMGEFSMTALQGSHDNVLRGHPAVILYLRTSGGRVHIERVGR